MFYIRDGKPFLNQMPTFSNRGFKTSLHIYIHNKKVRQNTGPYEYLSVKLIKMKYVFIFISLIFHITYLLIK